MAWYKRKNRTYYKRKTPKKDRQLVTVRQLKRAIKKDIEIKQHVAGWTDIENLSNTVGEQYAMMRTVVVGGTLQSGTQGVGDRNRIGAKIFVKSIEVRFNILLETDSYADYLRIMIVRDKFTAGTPITTSELITAIGPGNSVQAPQRTSLSDEYEVYYDKTILVTASPPTATVGNFPAYAFKFKKYFKNPIEVTYYPDANTGAIGDVQENNVAVILFSEYAAITVDNMYTSLEFYDA